MLPYVFKLVFVLFKAKVTFIHYQHSIIIENNLDNFIMKEDLSYYKHYYLQLDIMTEKMEDDKAYLLEEQNLNLYQKSRTYCRRHLKGMFEGYVFHICLHLKNDLEKKKQERKGKTTKIAIVAKVEKLEIHIIVCNFELSSTILTFSSSYQWILDTKCTTHIT